MCSRMAFSGDFVDISGTVEGDLAMTALLEAHPAMEEWPEGHKWFVAKLDLSSVWLINMFGGAALISPEDYYGDSGDGKVFFS